MFVPSGNVPSGATPVFISPGIAPISSCGAVAAALTSVTSLKKS